MPVAPKKALVHGCCRAVASCVAVEANPGCQSPLQTEQMKPVGAIVGVLVVEAALSFPACPFVRRAP